MALAGVRSEGAAGNGINGTVWRASTIDERVAPLNVFAPALIWFRST